MSTPRVLAICGDETGCAMWRVWQPFAELERRGYVAEWCQKDDSGKVLPLVAAGRYNVVVTPRIVWPVPDVGYKWINAIHNAGLAFVYEADDDVWSPGIVDRQMRLFESERAKGRAQLEWERRERARLVQLADGVTVSTRRLKTIVEQHTDKPVVVVPNAIDTRWFRRVLRGCGRVPELQGKLTIGWAGGTREDADLLPVAEAWHNLARQYPEVHFVVQGHIPKLLADAVPADRRATLPWLPLEEYPRALLNVDIGCANVAPLVFNTSKTPIKLWEYTLAGAVSVVSPTLYGSYVSDGEDGLIAETAAEWEAALSRLVEDAEFRRRLWRAQRRRVAQQHSLERNWWRWPEAWQTVLEDFRARPRLALPA